MAREAFSSPLAGALSLFSAALIGLIFASAVNWLLLSAVWPWQGVEACAEGGGVCWPFLLEKGRFILFGTYPYAEHLRPAAVAAMLCLLAVLTCRQMTGGTPHLSGRRLSLAWAVVVPASFLIMGGGLLGLAVVDPVRWNGLPILLMLSVIAVALAFPLGVLLALARTQTGYPGISRLATVYVEVARGVPMLTVLFVGIFVLPLTLPEGQGISPVTATLFALVLFHASYFAEDVRGGLLSLPPGQAEAAKALGLSYWQSCRLIILPQAIKRCLPSLMNSIIGAYKDTSLVVVVGILDLTATARMSFGDPGWRDYALEAYGLVGLWYFVTCAYLSSIGRRLHRNAPG